jgi:hypothetical protein
MGEMKWYYITVKWLDDEMEDAILGANEKDALESAFKNWPDAMDIVPVEGKTQEATQEEIRKTIPKLFKL